MEEKKEHTQINAAEARTNAEAAQKGNIEKALTHIMLQSNMGNTETVLFGYPLSLDGVKHLMDLGYTVTTITHPFENIKMYKVGW